VAHDTRIPSGTVAFAGDGFGQAVLMRRRPVRVPAPQSGFAGFRLPPEVIMVTVRWYLRFTPLLIDAARPCRHGAVIKLLGCGGMCSR
jgi:hypothetical protein